MPLRWRTIRSMPSNPIYELMKNIAPIEPRYDALRGADSSLSEDFASLLADSPVVVVPADFTDADAEIFVQVSRFEVTAAGVAVVEAQWRIVRTSDNVELVVERSEPSSR